MLQEILKERKLPAFREQGEMLDIVLREEYGYLPEKPEAVKWTVGGGEYGNFCAGKATW